MPGQLVPELLVRAVQANELVCNREESRRLEDASEISPGACRRCDRLTEASRLLIGGQADPMQPTVGATRRAASLRDDEVHPPVRAIQ